MRVPDRRTPNQRAGRRACRAAPGHVSSWLEHYCILSSSISTTLGGNWLTVSDVSVSRANDILGASYQHYRHVETNGTVLRMISYSLPEALHGYIQRRADDLLRLSAHGGNETADASQRGS